MTTQTQKPVVIKRTVTCKTIADDMTSRINGKLAIGFDDLFDPKTNTFLTESELKAKGAVFVTVSINKVLTSPSDCVKKSRTTKEPTPYLRKTSKYQVIGNINWQSFVNKRGHGDFVPSDSKANGVTDYNDCKAIGKTTKGFHTINGVAFRVLEPTKYFDVNGIELDKDKTEAEYCNKTSKASKQAEADKHGIDVKFDPQYRTTRMDSCDSIRCFGFDYQPTDRVK